MRRGKGMSHLGNEDDLGLLVVFEKTVGYLEATVGATQNHNCGSHLKIKFGRSDR